MCQVPGWRPADIPAHPYAFYGREAFRKIGGWPGFLNTDPYRSTLRTYRRIADAAIWAQGQGIVSRRHWNERCRSPAWRPIDIPAAPDVAYGSEQWNSIGRWAGFLNQDVLPTNSKAERVLRYILDDCFGQKSKNHQETIRGVSGQAWRVDFVAMNDRLVVEYDGAYFHRSCFDRDLRKTIDLTHSGWTVVRVRGEKMRKVNGKLDLLINQNGYPLDQVKKVLAHLTQLHGRGSVTVPTRFFKQSAKWISGQFDHINFRAILDRYDKYADIDIAAAWAKSKGTRSSRAWMANCLTPGWLAPGMPKYPPTIYGKAEWKRVGGWGGFLGTGRKSPTAQKETK